MTYTDAGIRGATNQSWRRANPRDLLKRVIDDHPGSDRVTTFKLFVEKLKEEDDDEYMQTIIEYWFTNNYHSLIAATTHPDLPQGGRAALAAARGKFVAAAKQKIRQAIEKEAKIVLLDMIMPNGKRLADCTGQECKFLSGRIGGWLREIAKRLEPEDTVGNVLAEDALQAIYEKRA